jgi:hypothetical protein
MVLNQFCYDGLLEKLRCETWLQVVDQLVLGQLLQLQHDQSDTRNHYS